MHNQLVCTIKNRVSSLIFCLLLCFILSPSTLSFAEPKHAPQSTLQQQNDGPEQTELWTGKIFTSKFKCGFCFAPSGKARGVLFLRTSFGQVDVYHLYGTFKDGRVDARHSSGHHVRGRVLDNNKVKGTIKLASGRKVTFKGTRTVGVPLAKEDCAPLEEW